MLINMKALPHNTESYIEFFFLLVFCWSQGTTTSIISSAAVSRSDSPIIGIHSQCCVGGVGMELVTTRYHTCEQYHNTSRIFICSELQILGPDTKPHSTAVNGVVS